MQATRESPILYYLEILFALFFFFLVICLFAFVCNKVLPNLYLFVVYKVELINQEFSSY